jgi:transcriptional regulator with PAS, ATPase and Fis domain
MMETVSDIVGKRLADIIDAPLFSALMQDQVDNELVSYRSHSFIVTRKLMEQYGEKSGSYFNFRDVTHIRQLEQTLNKKLQTRGFLPKYSFGDILTASPVMRKCVDLARKFAHSDLPVLISGESGTGKELLAHSMHVASKRSNQPFVAFNCAAVPESLIESELFGYEAGSFTGALKGGKTGLFEQANNGTVFLDEIGDMPYILQSKLLRVLQEMQVMRVGSQNIIAINIRVIAATNQDLEKKINQGQFRKDLFYRLNVLPLPVPPLRERTEDIAFLFRNFLKIGAGRDAGIAKEAEAALLRYRWPGNIRELWNVASYASFFDDAEISIEALPEYLVRSIDDFSIECDELSRSGLIEAAMEILKAIAQQTVANGGAGRASLRSLLESREIILSEGIIRRIMAVLNARNLIESGVGRNGSKISAKGASFINWYLNR